MNRFGKHVEGSNGRRNARTPHAAQLSAAALVLALFASFLSLATSVSTASAAGTGTITKALDTTQGGGFTAPNTFATGALVRYRLTYSCSSLTTSCGTATITDSLDSRLEYVSVILPSSTAIIVSPPVVSGQDISIGLSSFDGGDSGDLVVVARVRYGTAANTTIPNSATITVLDGSPVTTPNTDIVVGATNLNYGIDKAVLTPGTTPALGADVTYRVRLTASTRLGLESLSSLQVVDTYPANATVVNAAGGTVDQGLHTITWNVGAVDPLNMTCYNGTSDCELMIGDIVLNYDAPDFAAGNVLTNGVVANYRAISGTTGTLNDSAVVTLDTLRPGLTVNKGGPAQVVTGQTINWTMSVHNTGNATATNVILEDALPAGGFTNVKVVRPGYQYFFFPTTMGNAVIEQYVGGAWTSLGTYPGGTWPASVDPAATRVRIVMDALPSGQDLLLALSATAGNTAGTTLHNCADAYSDDGIDPAASCVDTSIVEPFNRIQTAKQVLFPDPATTSFKPGDEILWLLEVRNVAGVPASKFDVVDTLPAQFEYVSVDCVRGGPGSGVASLGSTSYPQYVNCPAPINPGVVSAPEVTLDVNAAGADRYHWSVDLTPGISSACCGTITSLTPDANFYMGVRVRVRAGTPAGTYTNQFSANTSVAKPECFTSGATITDTADVDGDGNVTEVFCESTGNVQIDEAAVVSASKWDDGHPGLPHVDQATGQPSADCPDWGGYTRYPCVAQTIPNGAFSYRWLLSNAGNVPLTDYIVYDVLPFVGDTGVSQTLSGTPRLTDWQPNLSGPVRVSSAPAAASPIIEYNLTTNPCRPELNSGSVDADWQATCDGTWLDESAIGDWSLVRSFRVRMFEPVAGIYPAWAPLEDIVLEADMVAPPTAITSTASPLDLSIAWNSVAHRVHRLTATNTTMRLPAAEPRKVGIIIPFDLVRLGNQVWLDEGPGAQRNNGVYDDGETPISGVTVELWKDDGDGMFNPLLDTRDGTTVTDADGNYWFSVQAGLDYFVAIPSGQTNQNGGALNLADTTASTPTPIVDDNDNNGAPVAGYASVSNLVSVTAGAAPASEVDTNDTTSAESEADLGVGSSVADTNSDLTVDFGFLRAQTYDLALAKVTPKAIVADNEVVEWTIRVRNQGNVTAGAFEVTDTIPIGMAFDSCVAPGGTCSESGGVVTYKFDDLAVDASVDMLLRTTITDVAAHPYRNWAEISVDSAASLYGLTDVDSTPDVTTGHDNTVPNDAYVGIDDLDDLNTNGVPANDEDDNDDAVVDTVVHYDLALAKVTTTPSPVAPGADVTWIVRVHNQGNVPSRTFDVTDQLPAGMSFVSASNGGVFANGAITWTALASLAPGAHIDLQVVTRIATVHSGDYRNWAEISADSSAYYGVTDKDSTPDVTTGADETLPNDAYIGIDNLDDLATDGLPLDDEDDNDDAVVNVTIVYDLALVKRLVTTGNVGAGDNVVFEIVVRNQGNVDSGVVTVRDELPTGLEFVSATGGGTATGSVIDWTIDNIAPQTNVSLFVTTRLISVDAPSYRNVAEISSDSSHDFGTDVVDKDSTPDADLANDPFVETDDPTIDRAAGDEDDHDAAELAVAQILGRNITAPTTTTTAATEAAAATAAAPSAVAFTGTNAGPLALLAAALVALGAALLVATRRRTRRAA